GRRDTARGGVLINYYRDGEQIGVVGINAVRAFTTTARMMLATPPRLKEPEPIYYGPRMLTAAPEPAPTSPPPAGPGGVPVPDRGRRDTARGGVLINYYRDGEQIGGVGINAVRAFTTTARMMLATPPRLKEPEPIYYGPRMLTAAPEPAPTSPPPAGPGGVPVSPAPRHRYVIDAPPDAVYDHGYQPVSGAQVGGVGYRYRAADTPRR